MQIRRRALLEEHVALVEEEDSVPIVGEFKHLAEVLLDFIGRETELSGAHAVEGLLHGFGDGLGGECLAGAWLPTEEHDHALPYAGVSTKEIEVVEKDQVVGISSFFLTFALDDIVEAIVIPSQLGVDKCPNNGLVIMRKDNLVEGSLIPGDGLDPVNVEYRCDMC